MSIFGVIFIITLIGVIWTLATNGLYVSEFKYDGHEWNTVPNSSHFSILNFASMVMLGSFLMPMILRPLDFLSNFKHYIVGLISYLFMMPTFINII